ncbi:MAG: hypothetical protein CMC08_00145 [Flavobacteriaceae bacterium]|nr:hypothetical protein [Flavobacteriaceae bacterium]
MNSTTNHNTLENFKNLKRATIGHLNHRTLFDGIYLWTADFISLETKTYALKCAQPVIACILTNTGSIKVATTVSETQLQLEPMECTIVKTNSDDTIFLSLKEKERYQFSMVHIHSRALYYHHFNSFLKSELKKEGRLFTKFPAPFILEHNNALLQLDNECPRDTLLAAGHVSLCLGKILDELQNNQSASRGNDLHFKEVEKIKSLAVKIRADISKEYTIEELCQYVGVSPIKLQYGFKGLFNCTAGQYILSLRLEEAVRLMRSTNLTISEIVYSIGLNSRSYFSRIFRRKYACTPTQFRTKLKGKTGTETTKIRA